MAALCFSIKMIGYYLVIIKLHLLQEFTYLCAKQQFILLVSVILETKEESQSLQQ